MRRELVVLKIGGSLLSRKQLTAELREWIGQKLRGRIGVSIVGGGGEVDVIRQRHAAGELSNEAAHWAAIDAMDRNTRQLAERVGLRLLTTLTPVPAESCFFPPGGFLRDVEPNLPGTRLPVGWQVTSDSIAARVASVLSSRLVLLKSTEPPAPAGDIPALAACGYVDAFFPTVSVELREVQFQTLEQ